MDYIAAWAQTDGLKILIGEGNALVALVTLAAFASVYLVTLVTIRFFKSNKDIGHE